MPQTKGEIQARYYANHLVSRREHSRQWRKDNPEENGECVRKYQRTPKGRFITLKSNARKRSIEVNLSLEHYQELVSSGLCFYCHAPLPEVGHGIDRIDSSKGYVIGNVRACCKMCNIAKSVVSEQEFKDWIQRIYKHWGSDVETKKA